MPTVNVITHAWPRLDYELNPGPVDTHMNVGLDFYIISLAGRIKIKLVPSVDFPPKCQASVLRRRRFMLAGFQLIFAFQIRPLPHNAQTGKQ